jgi:hypothetical protein
VKKHSTDWVAVATLVSGRTSSQCRHRWTKNLDPVAGKAVGRRNLDPVAGKAVGRRNLDPVAGEAVSRRKSEEDEKLIDAVREYAKTWVAVAAMIPGRTDQQCRSR